VLTGCLSFGHWSAGGWANTWHWTKNFTVFVSNRKQWQPQLLSHFLAYRGPRGGLYWKCHNYTAYEL